MATTGASRDAFGTRAGFILAAAGSAVGLGNMWRFSYQASEGGGAAFVLLYIGMTIILGIPLMLAEFGIGRRGQSAPVGALRRVVGPHSALVGWLGAVGSLLILSYYSVIAGWTVRYALEALFVGFPGDTGAHFGAVSAGGSAAAFHVGFMVATLLIVMAGIKGGIERVSLVLMPALFFIVAGLAVWAVTLDGAGEGYSVYLKPDVGDLMNPSVWRAAAAQAFFSLSLGMGAMMTFASYLDRQANLPQSATIVAYTDFGVAFVAGLVVFPVIFSFGLQGAVGASTVGALFIALPSAFDAMGAIGRVVGTAFFVALVVGALTSAISMLEVVTASFIDEFKVPRRTAATAAAILATLLGLLPALDTDVLGLMDKIAGEFLLVLGALLLAILGGWLVRKQMLEELAAGASPWWAAQVPRILAVLRFVVPPIVAAVLFFSARETVTTVVDFFRG
ncbi:MAG: sodium-dependent transporter [Steroidobacteraceae bacterium]|jgi:NSS family neurotransmitter:Na+ symporter|nr:sodium-dependent transporter [Steroidobacteraceae bacterium]